MSLSSILDDIEQDTDKVIPQISTEEITLSVPETSKTRLDTTQIDQRVIKKFSVLYNQLVMKQTVQNVIKLDRKIAQEVFTMLPESNTVDQAKITTYPSAMNKDVVMKALDGVSDKIPDSVMTLLQETLQQTENNQDRITTVVQTVNNFFQRFKQLCERFETSPPLVLYQKNSYNLYFDPFNKLSIIDDRQLDYPKYEETLSTKLYNVFQHKTIVKWLQAQNDQLDDISASTAAVDLSVVSIIENIGLVTQALIKNQETFNQLHSDLNQFLASSETLVNEKSNEVVCNLERLIFIMNQANLFHDVLDVPDNFLVNLEELLNFID